MAEKNDKPRRHSPGRARTTPAAIKRAEYVRTAIKLRIAGFTYDEILPKTDHFWKSKSAVFDAVKRELEGAKLDDATELKRLNILRLEAAIAVLMDKVEKGNLLAIDRLIKISKREGEILGFDESDKKDLTVGFEIIVKNESDREKTS